MTLAAPLNLPEGQKIAANGVWNLTDAGAAAMEKLDAGEKVEIGIAQTSCRVFVERAA